MYDDAAARGSIRPHQMGHWYDEPPYESDPDDFLMSGINAGPAAIIQVCFKNGQFLFIRILRSIHFMVKFNYKTNMDFETLYSI